MGFGQKPPVYLQPGDEINVTVTGLGTLTNRIASPSAPNPTLERYQDTSSSFPLANAARSSNLKEMVTINKKLVYYRAFGKADGPPMVFVHGLGATSEYFTPLISSMDLDQKYRIHVYDFEGHGLTPTHPLSILSIESLAADLNGIFEHADISANATLVADSLGCLIARRFHVSFPGKISKLVLISPPQSLLPETLGKRLHERADIARNDGMSALVDSAASSLDPDSLNKLKPLTLAARRISLLSQDPEGYAKACTAFGRATESLGWYEPRSSDIATITIEPKHLIVAGGERNGVGYDGKHVYGDAFGIGNWSRRIDVGGCWTVFQDLEALVDVLGGYLGGE